MIGYTLLVLIGLVVVSVGFGVVGVAAWHWRQEKKKTLDSQSLSQNP